MIRPIIRFAALPPYGPVAHPPAGLVVAGPLPVPGAKAAKPLQLPGSTPKPARPDRRRVEPDPLALAAREAICRACERLDADHCTHPGCPHCFRHPLLTGPWRTLRRCPAGLWGGKPGQVSESKN